MHPYIRSTCVVRVHIVLYVLIQYCTLSFCPSGMDSNFVLRFSVVYLCTYRNDVDDPQMVCYSSQCVCNYPKPVCNYPQPVCNYPQPVCNYPQWVCNNLQLICTNPQSCSIRGDTYGRSRLTRTPINVPFISKLTEPNSQRTHNRKCTHVHTWLVL